MFTSALNEKVLVFAHPTSSNRVFTTWFCPFSGRLGRFSLIAKMMRMHQHGRIVCGKICQQDGIL
jgi:hypothetical protein